MIEEILLPALYDLGFKNIPPLIWAIYGLLPEGLSILSAKPKTGKSWFALNLGLALTLPVEVFPGYSVEKGRVLYLALEDSDRRIKERITQLLNALNITDYPKTFHYKTSFPTAKRGGEEMLEVILENERQFKLIIIDTMNLFCPFDGKADAYQEANSQLLSLHEMALKYRVAIMLIHHSKKDSSSLNAIDDILGSTAIAGVVDSIYVMRKDLSGRVVLHITGRDIDTSELEIAKDPQTGLWRIVGDADKTKLSGAKQKIIDILGTGQAMTPKEIAEAGGLNYGSTRVLLPQMLKDEILIQPKNGFYQIKLKEALTD